jgi:capsule polysaccharide export protein KpsE/RkpR
MQSGHVETSVQRLREIEVGDAQNGSGEAVIDRTQTDNIEWAWLLWAKRRLLWTFTWRGLVLVTITAFLIPNRYESTARLMPAEKETGSGSGLAMMAAMAGGASGGGGGGGGASSLMGSSSLGGIASELLGTHDPGAVWSDMLASRTIKDRIIDRFDLRKVYGVGYWDKARKRLTKNTDISLDRKSGVITIVVNDRDRHRAQQIAQAYVDELDRLVALVSTSAARRERIFLEQRLEQVKQNLAEASNQFAKYASNNTVVDVDAQTKAMVEGAAALQGQLIAAQSELDGLQQIYTSNNVRVRSLKARVDELRSQLQQMGGSPALDSTGKSADPTQSDQLYPSIRKLPLLGVRWLDLYHETKMQEAVYGMLTEEYESAKIEEAKEIPTVKVLDSPSWPERKSSPPRILIVLLGMVLSCGAGVVWVLGTATWQQMDPQDPKKQLTQEVTQGVAASFSRLANRSTTIAWVKNRWMKAVSK